MIGNSNAETNFPHKLLLTDRQVSNFRKYFASNLSANTKLSETQLPKIVQSEDRLFQTSLDFLSDFLNHY